MGIAILLAGVAVIATGWLHHLYVRSLAGRSNAWPSAPGVVTASEVVRKIETTADNDLQDVYYARPSYTYEVEGEVLTGRRIRVGAEPRFTDQAKAQAVLAAYPAGAGVQVRYNPRKPSECALEGARPSIATPLIATAAGIVLALAGASLAAGS